MTCSSSSPPLYFCLPVRPRESGDPGAKHSNVSKSGPPLPRGRTESVAPPKFLYSVLKQLLGEFASSQKKIGPCLRLWARGSPAFLSSSVPSRRGGRRANKAHCPDCSGRVVRITPDDEVHCDAPRA